MPEDSRRSSNRRRRRKTGRVTAPSANALSIVPIATRFPRRPTRPGLTRLRKENGWVRELCAGRGQWLPAGTVHHPVQACTRAAAPLVAVPGFAALCSSTLAARAELEG